MILLPKYKDKKIAVMGLGVSGQATLASLSASGAEVYAWDENADNLAKCKELHSDANYSSFDRWPWKEIEVLVLSPGIPLNYPQPHPIVSVATVYGCEIMGDIELLMQAQPDAKFVGITGTNGKSTTTELTGHLLRLFSSMVQVGGNIGKPALALDPLGDGGIYVLEMSSYQLDLMLRSTFNVGVLLNISPDHLDRHGGIEGYVDAKKHIFDGMGVNDTIVISSDDQYCRNILKDLRDGKSLYSWQDVKPNFSPISVADECPVDLTNISTLQGSHNKQNVLAAIAVCEALGFDINVIKRGFKSFKGLEYRMQPIDNKKGVLFVNDSKATNAEATAYALDTYDDIYWILGGVAKDGGIDSLVEFFPKIKKAYLIGEASSDFAKLLRKHKVKFEKCEGLRRATVKAALDAYEHKENAVVLLSPACASFDQFANFEQRGERFTTQVKEILKTNELADQAKGDDT